MEELFWKLADYNAYIGFQCREYRKRHKDSSLRKWWFLAKCTVKNKIKDRYTGYYITENEIIGKIEKYDIISFDVFDTLLVRPYEKPTDLFYDLENRYHMWGFAKKRIRAEQMAREKYSACEDVNLEQIYAMLEQPYRQLKDKEMKLEQEVLRPNERIRKIYDEALRQQKRILIISDMYLPQKFIKKLLDLNGYGGYEEVYVSADIGYTKINGSMYLHVMEVTDQNPKDYLHIGDNFYSDGNACWKVGMGYLYVNCNQEKYILFGN